MLFLVTHGQTSFDNTTSNSGNIEIHAGLIMSKATGSFVDTFKTQVSEQNDLLGEAVNLETEIPFELGFAIGANYNYALNEKISLGSGLGFWRTQLSTRVNYEYRNPDFDYDEVGKDQTTFKLSYIALPLKLRYHLNKRWIAEAGVQFNFALKGMAEAVVQSERDVIINGELDEEWTRPLEETTIDLKDEAQSLILQYQVGMVYTISPLLKARLGFFGNGSHLTIEGQDLTSLGLQFGLRANLSNIIKR